MCAKQNFTADILKIFQTFQIFQMFDDDLHDWPEFSEPGEKMRLRGSTHPTQQARCKPHLPGLSGSRKVRIFEQQKKVRKPKTRTWGTFEEKISHWFVFRHVTSRFWNVPASFISELSVFLEYQLGFIDVVARDESGNRYCPRRPG